jgi:fatty acid desaturase
MVDSGFYNPWQYDLDRNLVRDMHKLEPARSGFAVAAAWVEIFCLILASVYLLPAAYFWWLYVVLIFFIAGRQGALLQLVHDGAHSSLSRSKPVNDAVGKFLCALPLGVNYEGYASGHMRHHTYTATDSDPPSDSEKYAVVDYYDPKLYLLFLKDLCGISALSVFLSYLNNASGDKKGDQAEEPASLLMRLRGPAQLCAVQLVVLGALFQFNIVNYILLWLVPASCIHMFLMRIRGMAEHGLAKQLHKRVARAEEGTFYTRSFGTPFNRYAFAPFVWLERALIGSFNVYYHHEHHLFPNVPFYNLPKLHKMMVRDIAAANRDVYAKGYLAAALRKVTT